MEVYDCFNNHFPADCSIPALNISPITIDDRIHPDKRDRYTPDMLPAAIFVASEKYGGTFTTRYNYPQFIVLTSHGPNCHHAIKKYNPVHGRAKRG